jgi:hypothetical protein
MRPAVGLAAPAHLPPATTALPTPRARAPPAAPEVAQERPAVDGLYSMCERNVPASPSVCATQILYTLYLSSGPGATGSTGVRVEGGQGVCGRGGGGGGLIYWEDMAYHCHPLLRGVLQRCCCCCGPSCLGAVRCVLILLGPLSLLPGLRRGTGTLCRRGRWTCRPGCSSCTRISAPGLVRTLPRCRCDAVPRLRLAAGCWSAFPAC